MQPRAKGFQLRRILRAGKPEKMRRRIPHLPMPFAVAGIAPPMATTLPAATAASYRAGGVSGS